MIVKILDYNSKKGLGAYQELTGRKSKQAFRYNMFQNETMINPGDYATIKKGKLVKINIGFFYGLWLKMRCLTWR